MAGAGAANPDVYAARLADANIGAWLDLEEFAAASSVKRLDSSLLTFVLSGLQRRG